MPLGLQTAELNFENLEEIGQEGRNSTVFIAHDKQLDGKIVVKVIPKDKLVNAAGFYSEAKILYASAHSNVVEVKYGCSDAENIYIAMPYYGKGSLKSLIGTRYLTVREVIRYSIQFLSGLAHIHSKGLVHLDVKPDNILLSDSDEALLSDFGLAKAMNAHGYASQEKVYSKHIPPETLYSEQKTIQFDIYMAGLTLYRLLNGNEPFYEQYEKFKSRKEYLEAIEKGKFPDRTFYLPHVPRKLRKIVNNALEVDLSKRYKNVLHFINDLSTVENNLDLQFKPEENLHVWELNKIDKEYLIKLEQDSLGEFKISTTKTIKKSARRTKVSALCFSKVKRSEINSKLDQVFKKI